MEGYVLVNQTSNIQSKQAIVMKSITCLFGPLLLATISLSSLARAQSEDEHPMLLLSEDESFHFEILGPMAEAIYGGADVGPVLGAAKNITAGDFDSFSEVFYSLANQTKAEAEDPLNAYDPINVRETWFSASTYFRRADFYLHGNWDNPLISTLWEEQTAAFDKAIAALPVPGKRLRIPASNFTVEAIWYAASHDDCTRRPTLILGNGYDGAQEDMYHTIVAPALARGWNALTYEGPGHPSVRRGQNIGFIPDWERVVTPLVDHLLSEKSNVVDPERLVLFGFSYGGYQAARAAAFEPRLSAVLLDGGVWDTYEAYSSNLSPELLEMFEAGEKEAFDEAALALRTNPDVPSTVRWGLEHGLWSFNTKSPYEFFELLKLHTIKDVVHQIQMPVWIADAEFEGFFRGQAPKVKDALGDLATLHVFRGTAGYHCQIGAFQELGRVMFAWLNQTLGKR